MQFTNITVEWSPKTFIFYLAIIIGCYYIPKVFKRKIKIYSFFQHQHIKIPGGILLAGLILIVVKALCVSGRDVRTGYYMNFMSATSLANYRDNTVEISYRLLMVLVRNIFGSQGYPVFLLITSLMTVIPVLNIINKYREKIYVPAAMMMFASIYYFQGFSLNRIYLAASIGLLAFDAMLERKEWKSAIYIIFAATFHISSLILFLPFFLMFFRKIGKKLTTLFALMLVLAIYLGRNSIGAMMSGTTRYYLYNASTELNLGLEQFIYYLPIVVLYTYSVKKIKLRDKQFDLISLIYTLTGFAFGLAGYIVPIFGRMQVLFLPLIITVGYYLKPLQKKRNLRITVNIITVAYCIARFYIYISQYYLLDDVMPYCTFFGSLI